MPTIDRVTLFVAWGEKHIEMVAGCLRDSRLPSSRILVVTDGATPVSVLPPGTEVLRRDFAFSGKERKAEALASLPASLQSVLFLDVDTRILGDVSLGFDKAERHGIAMAPAPHYSLAHFRGFATIMEREGVPRQGQMIYNSGVIFFDWRRDDVREVFGRALALLHKDPVAPWGDQPYITLAMEMAGFNPYTLSPSFNHRAFGELISGPVRIWHSYQPMPPDATNPPPGYLYRCEDGRLVRALKVPL